MSFEERLYYP